MIMEGIRLMCYIATIFIFGFILALRTGYLDTIIGQYDEKAEKDKFE